MLNTTALIHLLGCSLVAQDRSLLAEDVPARHHAPSGRIIGGKEVAEGEFNFVVQLRRKLDHVHKCGSTILTKHWLLTAAHCCNLGPPRCFSLYSGSVSRESGGKERFAVKFITHEDYYFDDGGHKNDICLIRVFPPFFLGDKLQQVTLPKQDKAVPGGELAVAAGWGYTSNEPDDDAPDRMRKVEMITLEKQECVESTPNVTESNYIPGFLCARGSLPGQGICQGDSGGPLLWKGVQVGIASFHYAECGNPIPDYFVRVPLYIDWIKEKLGFEATDLKFSNFD